MELKNRFEVLQDVVQRNGQLFKAAFNKAIEIIVGRKRCKKSE